MEIQVKHIPFSTAHNRRPNIKMVPNSITVHSTGNETSNADGERAWLENPSNVRTASWHYVVDEDEIIEAIPPNYVAYHAGDGNGQGNMASIGIEMCESGNRQKVLVNTVWLVRYLMKKHNIRKVVRHYDWTKKNCPRILNTTGKWEGWSPFIAEVMKADVKEGWKLESSKWFLYEKGTQVKDKWVKYKEKWFYLAKDGVMAASEWVKWEGKWYYVNAKGEMLTGWHSILHDGKHKLFYFHSDGHMASNEAVTVKIDGNGEIIHG